MLEVNTFSISARCAKTGMLGVAVSTAVPGVGGICPFVKPGVGAVSTQSWVNPYLGIDGLKLLEQGKTAQEALDTLIDADPGRDVRQLGIVDAAGRSAAWSGAPVHRTGSGTSRDLTSRCREICWSASVQFRRWRERSRAPRASRFRSALWPCSEAGQSAGGDKRGRQSAALLVYRTRNFLTSVSGGRARASSCGIAPSL